MLISMGMLTRRLQILIDEGRYAVLARESARTGKPMSELVREAVDARYGVDVAARAEAYETILAAAPMPVADWATMKARSFDPDHEPE